MDLRKSLRKAIANDGIKHKDLADKLGTSSQQISNWLKSGSIKQTSLVAICKVFNMPVSEFIALGEEV